MKYLILPAPGIFLITLQAICIVQYRLFDFVNPIFLWVAVTTVGIPCVVVGLLRLVSEKLKFSYFANMSGRVRFFLLLISTIPSIILFIKIWLFFRPVDGPGIGYMGLFYVGFSFFWIPVLLFWSLASVKLEKYA